jgi:D-aminoacyl-tRNA deacylase
MKSIIQRVSQSSVRVGDETIGAIGKGVMVLLGVAQNDSEQGAEWLAEKIVNLRIFEDDNGKMNRSLLDIGGSALVVSQFTLYGDCRKGRRPSFVQAAAPEKAEALYDYFIEKVKRLGVEVATGRFRAMMQVSLVNDGPVTLIIETP